MINTEYEYIISWSRCDEQGFGTFVVKSWIGILLLLVKLSTRLTKINCYTIGMRSR